MGDSEHETKTSRRQVLGFLSAIGAGALLHGRLVDAQSAAHAGGAIDTHHHIYPPRYVAENIDRLMKETPGLERSFFDAWPPSRTVAEMDKAGIATVISSITTPGVWFDDGDKARVRSRQCNEYGAQVSRDFPRRFGMFATIPLPDTDGSLREIEYALDVLKLDGIGLLTSYAGRLLGDPLFRAVLDEINRRKAVVYVHPTMSCCGNIFPGIPDGSTIEYPADTARTIASLLLSGTFATLPDIKFIFSHGGGVLPSIYYRVLGVANSMPTEERAKRIPKGMDYELQRQYYDTAGIGSSVASMAAVLKLFPVSQITCGSDAPFGSLTGATAALGLHGLSAADVRAIRRDNALRLFPRLAI